MRDKYLMRFNEFRTGFQKYVAWVRVTCGSTTSIAKTIIEAETKGHAWTLLCHVYGSANVLSVVQALIEEAPAVLSADEQRVKAMSDQARRLTQQAKQLKAQDAVRKAQARLNKALAR
jgi:transposase